MVVALSAAPIAVMVSPVEIAVGVAALVVLVLLVVIVWRVVRVDRTLRGFAREGREKTVVAEGTRPLTNFRHDGTPSDPLNVKIIATSGQLGAAFTAAGWYRADELTLISSIRIAIDAVLGRKYSTAPVSTLYLYGRPQDYAFEREGKSVRQRDHVRFWDTGERCGDGRRVWIGGATQDIAVELSPKTHLPTHKIAPDTDVERGILAEDLILTGWVVDETFEPGFGKPTEMQNADSDPWRTDGRVAVLTLADVSVLPFAAAGVHGRVPVRIAGTLGRPARHVLLPRSGRERAHRLRERKRTPERAAVPAGKAEE